MHIDFNDIVLTVVVTFLQPLNLCILAACFLVHISTLKIHEMTRAMKTTARAVPSTNTVIKPFVVLRARPVCLTNNYYDSGNVHYH